MNLGLLYEVDIKQRTKDSDAPRGSRARYSAPRLKVFGPVGALTQAGTERMAEMGPPGGTGPMQMTNMQRT